MAITASEARKNLFPLIEQVNDDRTPSRSPPGAGMLCSSPVPTTKPSRKQRTCSGSPLMPGG